MQSQNPVPNDSPLSQIAQAAENLAVHSTTEEIVADIQTALGLFLQFKQSLNGLHPTVLDVIKFLL